MEKDDTAGSHQLTMLARVSLMARDSVIMLTAQIRITIAPKRHNCQGPVMFASTTVSRPSMESALGIVSAVVAFARDFCVDDINR